MNSTASLSIEIIETITETVVIGLKRCTKCHEYKPHSEFRKDSYRADGYTNKCWLCIKHYRMAREESEYRGTTGYWSKWGGSRMSAWREDPTDEWFCQSCGIKHPNIIPPFIYEISEREHIRVCAICLADGCIRYKQRLLSEEN